MHSGALARLFVLVALVGCNKNGDEASETSTNGSAGNGDGVAAPPSARTRLATHRALLDEVVRAEVDANGPVIDFGTPAQHKYTRGGWRSGWGKLGRSGDVDWGALKSRRGFLELGGPRGAVSEIVVRARSRTRDQKLTFFVGEHELGTVKLASEWKTLRVPVEADEIPVTPRLRFEVRASRKADGARAELDWLWLATASGEPALGPRIAPLAIAGKARRALAAPTARTYTFYVQPPPGAQLVVDLGAAEHAEFVVTATVDGAAPTELSRATVERGWTERAISLSAFAGKAVRLDLATTEQRGAAGWGEPEIMVERTTAPVAGTGRKPKNVIFILMDTMRADSFAVHGGPDRVVKTPVYDALAKQSTVFTSAYDNENWTKPSVATTLTGLYPSTHDTKKDDSKLPDDVELLPQHLKRHGFTTAGFVANGYISGHFGFERGWDTFKNYIRESKPSEAEHVFEDALEWHAEHVKRSPNKPFFLYLQTIDPHVTYRVDEKYWRPYFEGEYDGPLGPTIDAEDQVKLSKKGGSDRDIAWLRAMYWGEVSYHDEQLGKFLDELRKRKALDDTLLVLTNDHGEELGERGRFGHGHQIFEEMIRAPLLVHYPPVFPAGKQIREIVEHVDLAPTILDALGQPPLADADGESFLPVVRGLPVRRPMYAMTEFLDGRRVLRVGIWKLVSRAGGSAELFDLVKDREEHHDIAEAAPIARRLCEVHLGEVLATPDKTTRLQGLGSRKRFRAGAANIDPQMRRQLEALGYFGGDSKKHEDDEDDEDD